MYGLHPKKGSIAIGADADVAVWDPKRRTTISDADVHDRTGFTPYVGRQIEGWPVTVLRRGEVIVESSRLLAAPGSGTFLPRAAGPAAEPTGRLAPEFDPTHNFGAELY